LVRVPTQATAAGRTDAGVHARGQVAHIDTEASWEPYRLMEAINFHLKPDPICVRLVEAVSDEFHARFHAVERRYRYRILCRRAPPTLDRDRVWHIRHPLDSQAMAEGGALLIGRHDFTSFRAVICQAKSPIKTLSRIRVSRVDEEVWIDVAAPSFLHHQVRNIVGTLLEVGIGRWPVARVGEVLAARDRSVAGQTAPAAGLTFLSAHYLTAETM
jgi:tRNA pseudouridine38-40 synthase